MYSRNGAVLPGTCFMCVTQGGDSSNLGCLLCTYIAVLYMQEYTSK